MNANMHECRCKDCHAALILDIATPHVLQVPLRPLTESIDIKVLAAIAQNPIELREN